MFPDPHKMSKQHLNERYKDACSLLDGVYDVIFIWQPKSPSQEVWKKQWLERARAHGASLE